MVEKKWNGRNGKANQSRLPCSCSYSKSKARSTKSFPRYLSRANTFLSFLTRFSQQPNNPRFPKSTPYIPIVSVTLSQKSPYQSKQTSRQNPRSFCFFSLFYHHNKPYFLSFPLLVSDLIVLVDLKVRSHESLRCKPLRGRRSQSLRGEFRIDVFRSFLILI